MPADRPRSSDDEEFDRIVAGLDLSVPSELDEPPRRDPAPAADDDGSDDLPGPRGLFEPRMSDPLPAPDPDDDDRDDPADRFVPPPIDPGEPLDTATRVAWVGLVGPPVVLVVATILQYQLPRAVSAVLVLTSIAALVYLIGRRGNDHRDDDPDHGAVL